MKISTIIKHLEELAPISYQESYDNCGLLVGNQNLDVNAVLVSLDCLEETIDEAIELKAGLVIVHHPVIFKGLKSLTGRTYVERTILKAIKNEIAIYAAHTNLDNIKNGVNDILAKNLGLKNREILAPKRGLLEKLVFFSPFSETEKIKAEIFKAGAGAIGNYDCCSFTVEGKGSFKAEEGANPHVGNKHEVHTENEHRVEVIVPTHLKSSVLKALLIAHPYEEVAFDFYPISNPWNQVGSGIIGELKEEIHVNDFLEFLKNKLPTTCIRHSNVHKAKIRRVAICGGSGSYLLPLAMAKNADVFISADFKYHQFFDADDKILIADVGHYESEQHTPAIIQEYLKEKIPNFAAYLSNINTNPINYR